MSECTDLARSLTSALQAFAAYLDNVGETLKDGETVGSDETGDRPVTRRELYYMLNDIKLGVNRITEAIRGHR